MIEQFESSEFEIDKREIPEEVARKKIQRQPLEKIEGDEEEDAIVENYFFEIEIDEKKFVIEAKKKIVKFPERLVKETGGVTGYVRFIIENEALRGPLQDLLGNDVQLPQAEIGSDEFWENFEHNEHEKEIKNIIKKLIARLLDALSNGEFPRQTFNHVYRGVWDSNIAEIEISKAEGLILQKIFNPQTILKSIEFKKRKNPKLEYFQPGHQGFTHYQLLGEKPDGTVYELPYKLDYGESMHPEKWKKTLENITQLFKHDSSLEDDTHYFMISAGAHGHRENYTGLATAINGNYYKDGRPDINVGISNAMVGFSLANKAFKEYLEKIYQKILPLSKGANAENYWRTIEEIKYLLGGSSSEILLSGEVGIPVVFGDSKDIPELRWCHAQYAFIPTKNRINLLKMTS